MRIVIDLAHLDSRRHLVTGQKSKKGRDLGKGTAFPKVSQLKIMSPEGRTLAACQRLLS